MGRLMILFVGGGSAASEPCLWKWWIWWLRLGQPQLLLAFHPQRVPKSSTFGESRNLSDLYRGVATSAQGLATLSPAQRDVGQQDRPGAPGIHPSIHPSIIHLSIHPPSFSSRFKSNCFQSWSPPVKLCWGLGGIWAAGSPLAVHSSPSEPLLARLDPALARKAQ